MWSETEGESYIQDSHSAVTSNHQVRLLVVKMLHRIVDHHVRVPDLVRGDVDVGDVLVVGGHPLQSGVLPPHDEPDVGVEGGGLGVDVDMKGHHVDPENYSSEGDCYTKATLGVDLS